MKMIAFFHLRSAAEHAQKILQDYKIESMLEDTRIGPNIPNGFPSYRLLVMDDDADKAEKILSENEALIAPLLQKPRFTRWEKIQNILWFILLILTAAVIIARRLRS